MSRAPRLFAALLALTLLGGCAYFNTFYHAKKFYGEAQKLEEEGRKNPTNQRTTAARASQFYTDCIEKCRKVIENYPGSKWQDDATLLMAQAYYGKNDYLSARSELTRFLSKFPESDKRGDALFWLGRTEFAAREFDAARAAWDTLAVRYPKYDEMEEVVYFRARALVEEGRPEDAMTAYRTYLEQYGGKKRADEARLDLGELYAEQRRYDEAETEFTRVAEKGRESQDRVAARLALGEVLEDRGDLAEALDTYREIAFEIDPNVMEGRISAEEREEIRVRELAALEAARRDSIHLAMVAEQEAGGQVDVAALEAAEEAAREQQTLLGQQAQFQGNDRNRRGNSFDPDDPRYANLARALLREGRVRAGMEQPWEALLAYEQVIAEYPRTEFAAEAQYRIAYTHEVYLDDYDEAERNYELVATHGLSTFNEDAGRRAGNLDTVRRMSAALDDSTAAETGAAAEARFLRAELYLYQQDKPRRALAEYRSIQEDFAGTDYAAKAVLAEAWVYENEIDEPDSARAILAALTEDFPDTEYGAHAARRLHGPQPEPDPAQFAGPALDHLLTPENIAAVTALRETLDPTVADGAPLAEAAPDVPADAAATMAAITAGTAATAGGSRATGSSPAAVRTADVAGLDPFAVPAEGTSPILNAWQREPEAVFERTGTLASAPGVSPPVLTNPPIEVAASPDTLAAPGRPGVSTASDTTAVKPPTPTPTPTPPPAPAPRQEAKEEPKEAPREGDPDGR